MGGALVRHGRVRALGGSTMAVGPLVAAGQGVRQAGHDQKEEFDCRNLIAGHMARRKALGPYMEYGACRLGASTLPCNLVEVLHRASGECSERDPHSALHHQGLGGVNVWRGGRDHGHVRHVGRCVGRDVAHDCRWGHRASCHSGGSVDVLLEGCRPAVGRETPGPTGTPRFVACRSTRKQLHPGVLPAMRWRYVSHVSASLPCLSSGTTTRSVAFKESAVARW